MATLVTSCLAMGQLATTGVTDILVPVGVKHLVHNITFYNSHSGSVTLKVYRYNGATSCQVYSLTMSAYSTLEYALPAEGWVIESTHKFQLQAGTGNLINYFIDGSIETP